jgi:hypothetical protein
MEGISLGSAMVAMMSGYFFLASSNEEEPTNRNDFTLPPFWEWTLFVIILSSQA